MKGMVELEKEKRWKVVLDLSEWQHQVLKRLELGLLVLDPESDVIDEMALSMGMDPVTCADCVDVLTCALYSAYHEEVRC